MNTNSLKALINPNKLFDIVEGVTELTENQFRMLLAFYFSKVPMNVHEMAQAMGYVSTNPEFIRKTKLVVAELLACNFIKENSRDRYTAAPAGIEKVNQATATLHNVAQTSILI